LLTSELLENIALNTIKEDWAESCNFVFATRRDAPLSTKMQAIPLFRGEKGTITSLTTCVASGHVALGRVTY
jgi:hypothetical protein